MSVINPTGKVIFSMDAETIGLYGEPFAFAYVVCDENGYELENGFLNCPADNAKGTEENRKWIVQNVIPKLPAETNCKNPDELCNKIYEIWMRIKNQYHDRLLAIADCGYPVETNLFARAICLKESEREFTGFYPLHEVATALLLAGIDRSRFPRNANELPEHVPLNDARYALRLFLTAWKSK